jgi:predicted small lipoprotein YifL
MTAKDCRNRSRFAASSATVPPRFVRGFVFVLPSRLNLARLKFGRTLLVVGLLGVALAACGRKGPLEAPPNVSGAVDLPDNQIGAQSNDVSDYGSASVLAKPAKANRAITVPEKPFLLDPLM